MLTSSRPWVLPGNPGHFPGLPTLLSLNTLPLLTAAHDLAFQFRECKHSEADFHKLPPQHLATHLLHAQAALLGKADPCPGRQVISLPPFLKDEAPATLLPVSPF